MSAEDAAPQVPLAFSTEGLQRAAEATKRVAHAEVVRAQDVTDEILRVGERVTGLTREQLLAMPDDLAEREPPKPVERVKRAVVKLERGVPEKHLRAIYDREPIECEALEQVRAFLRSDLEFLVLFGAVGTRKSGSACWALTQRSGRYVKAYDLATIDARRDPEDRDIYRRIRNAGLLVIDDVGTEYGDEKGFFKKAFNALIDARYESCEKTILTVNVRPEQFSSDDHGYGARIMRRLSENGLAYEVPGGWERGK